MNVSDGMHCISLLLLSDSATKAHTHLTMAKLNVTAALCKCTLFPSGHLKTALCKCIRSSAGLTACISPKAHARPSWATHASI